MPTVVRILIFGLVSLLLAPLSILGMAAYVVFLLLFNRRKGISGTAYEPFMGRLMMHDAGEREDSVARKLADGLPALPPPTWSIMMGPTKLAGRLSGYVPSLLAYPGPRPASLMAAMGLRTEFFDRTLRDSLDTVGQVVIFDPTVPTHVIWEGVTMYLEEETVVDTLRTVARLPAGSTLAFDYFARQLIHAEPPWRLLSKLTTTSIAWFYSEHLVFGYDMQPPAREKMADWLAENRLQLCDCELLRGEERGKMSIYGFVLASPGRQTSAD